MMHTTLAPTLIEEFQIKGLIPVGIFYTIPLIGSLLIYLPSGLLADKIKHKIQIAMSLGLAAIAAILINSADSFLLLVLPVFLVLGSSQLMHPPLLSAVSEMFPEQYRSRSLGIQNAIGAVGIALGPLSLWLLLESHGWRFVYLLWSIPAIVLALVIFIAKNREEEKVTDLPDPIPRKNNLRELLGLLSGGFLILLIANSVQGMGVKSVSTFFTTYLFTIRDIPNNLSSLLVGLGMLIGAGGTLLGGFLGDKVGNIRWLTMGFIGCAVSLVSVPFGSMGILIVSYLLYSFFVESTIPTMLSLVARFSPISRRGVAYGIFFLPFGIVGAIAPTVAALLADTIGIGSIFLFSIGLFIVTIILIQILKEKKEYQLRTKKK